MKTTNTDYDALVVGGGPAGTTAAGILARLGHKVALFERERFPRHRIGESLLPATTMGILSKLGARELIEKQGFPRKYGGTFLWGSEREPWTFNFYRTSDIDRAEGDHPEYLHSFQVERQVYDELLLNHVKTLGVEVHEEALFESLDAIDAPIKTATVTIKGEARTFRAPFVVDAGGRNSKLRPLFGERHYDPFFMNVAIYSYFEGGKRLKGERWGNILAVAFPHGWFWYIPLSETLTSVGVVMTRERYNQLKDLGEERIFHQMVDEAPMVKEFLQSATRSTRAPYDRFRVEIDYSYIHSQFTHAGTFLCGDAACFIDPVFSSGVHLASYSGYLAANAIHDVLVGQRSYKEATTDYEQRYRREYMIFYRFLTAFYQMHTNRDSYFWEARKVLGTERGSDLDAFISIVSGQGSAADLFDSLENFQGSVQQGVEALSTLIARAQGETPDQGAMTKAMDFMKPLHESRRDLFRKEET